MTNNRRRFEAILREPLTRQRLALNAKIRAAQQGGENATPFTLDDFKNFANGLQAANRGRVADPVLTAEIANAITAVETGVAPKTPKFETPETQLVWGAALAYLLLNQQQMQSWATPVAEGELRSSDLWKQVTNTRRAHNELLSHAHHVREALRDKDTRYGWSDPGTGFTFQRQKNIINIDLMQSLIVGFEHARADVYREIGHSLLSTSYPQRMRDVYAEMQPLMRKMQQAQGKNGKKGKGPQLKDDEYKKLRLLSAEWQLRHMMYSAAEENVTSRFVANMGKQMLQDYSVSMNNTAVTFRGIGLTRLPNDGQMSEDLRRYMNLCNTVQISFYQNNGLFDDTDAGWRGVGIDPALVRKLSTFAARPEKAKTDKDGINHDDFKFLRELCGGPNGLENLQPKQHERLYGWGNLKGRINRAAADRAAIIEQIWALYAEELIQNILEHTKDQIDEDLEKAKQNQQDQDQDGQDGQDQDGDDGQDQDGQDGQDGQGQGQGQGQGKGKPQKGQKPQKNKNKDRNKPQGEQVDPEDMDDADGQDGQKGDKSKQDKKDKNQKGDKGDKSDQDGDDQDADGQNGEGDEQDGQVQDGQDGDQNGKDGELGADKENTVPVEGAGDMPAPEAPFEDPSDELDPDGNGNDADGEGQDGEGQDADGSDADGDDGEGMTQEEIEQALQEAEDAENEGEDADAQDADGEGQDGQDGQQAAAKKSQKGKAGKKGGQGDGQKLGDLSRQDWTQYQQRINELSGPISRVRKLFKDIQERQLQRKSVQSPKLDIIPENGEVKDRFNIEAHRNLTLKKVTGQMTADDLKRFHTDEIKMTPTQIDIVLLIDGSSSMNGVPLNSALQSAAIMFEAAAGKDMNINVYVCMWGDKNPEMIIRPGADRVKVGQAMQAARKGLNSGTDFAPAVETVAKTIAEDRGKSGVLSGFTHVLILSDGDIFDEAPSVERIKTLFTYSDKVTFDTAIIGKQPGSNTRMEKMARSIKGHKPFQQVGVTLGSDPNQIPMEIVGLLLEKVRKCGSFTAVPTSQKRRAMQKAHNKMDPKR